MEAWEGGGPMLFMTSPLALSWGKRDGHEGTELCLKKT